MRAYYYWPTVMVLAMYFTQIDLINLRVTIDGPASRERDPLSLVPKMKTKSAIAATRPSSFCYRLAYNLERQAEIVIHGYQNNFLNVT